MSEFLARHKGKAGLRESPHKPVTKRGRCVRAPWTGAEQGPHRRPLGVACRGDTGGVTRQALLLDVKEALVDEFVDAEGA